MAKSSGLRTHREVPNASRIDCVYLTCFRSEFSVLAIVLHYSSIRMHRAETLEEADFLLTVTGATVLLSDVAFLDGSWQDAMLMLRQVHPLVAAFVIADRTDGPLLNAAYETGACGALSKPVKSTQARRLIRNLHEVVRDRLSVLSGDLAETVWLRPVEIAIAKDHREDYVLRETQGIIPVVSCDDRPPALSNDTRTR